MTLVAQQSDVFRLLSFKGQQKDLFLCLKFKGFDLPLLRVLCSKVFFSVVFHIFFLRRFLLIFEMFCCPRNYFSCGLRVFSAFPKAFQLPCTP